MASPQPLRAPLLWLLLPFMGGLVLAENRPCGPPPGAVAAAGALLAAGAGGLALRGRPGALETAVLLAAGTTGYLWLPLRSPAGHPWPHAPREVTVELEVEQVFASAPGARMATGLGRVTAATGPAAPLAGQRVAFAAIRRVGVPPAPTGRYRFHALVENLPDAAGARGFERHLASLGIRVRLGRGRLAAETRPPTAFRRFCLRTQARLGAILRHGIEDRPDLASVQAAMLLGERALLPEDQETAFMRSGVFHIFSISGLHVGVIALALLSALRLLRVPGPAARLLSLAVLGLYVQVTGGGAPAERAFLMVAFVVAGRVCRWPGNPLASLAAAALVTLVLDPRQLFGAGFQMSYGAVTAIVVLGAPLARRATETWTPWADLPEADWGWWRHAIRGRVRALLGTLAVTWAATLASTPSGIAYFGLLSPGSLAANLLVVPLASLALVAGFVALVAGLAGLAPVVVLMNHASGLLIAVMDALVRRGVELPGMWVAAEFRAPWMGPAALAVVLGAILLSAQPRLGRGARLWLPPAALAAGLILGVRFP
jgi:competence protein ComEC